MNSKIDSNKICQEYVPVIFYPQDNSKKIKNLNENQKINVFCLVSFYKDLVG